MRGDIGQRHLRDVAGESVVAVVVGPVGQLGIFVPLAGENAAPAQWLEPAPQPADAGEQVDEAKSVTPCARDYRAVIPHHCV